MIHSGYLECCWVGAGGAVAGILDGCSPRGPAGSEGDEAAGGAAGVLNGCSPRGLGGPRAAGSEGDEAAGGAAGVLNGCSPRGLGRAAWACGTARAMRLRVGRRVSSTGVRRVAWEAHGPAAHPCQPARALQEKADRSRSGSGTRASGWRLGGKGGRPTTGAKTGSGVPRQSHGESRRGIPVGYAPGLASRVFAASVGFTAAAAHEDQRAEQDHQSRADQPNSV